jgi:hypothetical protein
MNPAITMTIHGCDDEATVKLIIDKLARKGIHAVPSFPLNQQDAVYVELAHTDDLADVQAVLEG